MLGNQLRIVETHEIAAHYHRNGIVEIGLSPGDYLLTPILEAHLVEYLIVIHPADGFDPG
jgi:hypothetical protein